MSIKTKQRLGGEESHYGYGNDNCAEIGALDKAYKDGARDEDLVMHTKKNEGSKTNPNYQDAKKCKNCQRTNGDIQTTSECGI